MSATEDTDPRPRIHRFESLPERVKFVRPITGKKDQKDLALVECGHPLDMRGKLSVGPRAGAEICRLCKGMDFTRTCFTLAFVAPVAQVVTEEPLQAALF